MNQILIDGYSLTCETLHQIAFSQATVKLTEKAISDIKSCREFLESKLRAGEIMYGVNTGIGEFSEVTLSDDQVKDFQKYLIYNHSAGIGEPLPIEHVRAAIASRINVHAKGHSAIRYEITYTLIEMLNKGVTPVVCSKGSVGASGDLAPMSQIALTLMGEGEVFYNGDRIQAAKGFELAGIKIPGLMARDGLGTINGSNVLTSISALTILEFEKIILHAEIAASMSLEALQASMKPYDLRLHKKRGFKGSVESCEVINKCLKDSDLVTGKLKTKVQDAYSMRSTPQVIGAARDAINYAKSQVEIELNGVCDNPVFLWEDGVQLSGANFQGTPVALPMDMAGAAITMICVLSERRLNRLLNPALSQGLPPFLTHNPGFFSGMMLSQYTADTLIVEQRILSAPASIQSIPAAADQEDFVSMGMNTAHKNTQIMNNAYSIIGIELMAAAQALNFREHNFGSGVKAAFDTIRKHIDYLDIDRPLYIEHNKVTEIVKSAEILNEVEKVIGKL